MVKVIALGVVIFVGAVILSGATVALVHVCVDAWREWRREQGR